MKCKMALYSSFVPVVIIILKSDIDVYMFAFVVLHLIFILFDNLVFNILF